MYLRHCLLVVSSLTFKIVDTNERFQLSLLEWDEQKYISQAAQRNAREKIVANIDSTTCTHC